MPVRTPALKAMTTAEKGELLDALLTAHPALRDRVEALAAARMSAADRSAVAKEVEFALRGLDIDQLNGRAGYRVSVMSIRGRRPTSFSTRRCSRSSTI